VTGNIYSIQLSFYPTIQELRFGSGGLGRSYSIIDAKLLALRRCEHYSPLPVCTILWCRPGG
jgi:hypothetical protein